MGKFTYLFLLNLIVVNITTCQNDNEERILEVKTPRGVWTIDKISKEIHSDSYRFSVTNSSTDIITSDKFLVGNNTLFLIYPPQLAWDGHPFPDTVEESIGLHHGTEIVIAPKERRQWEYSFDSIISRILNNDNYSKGQYYFYWYFKSEEPDEFFIKTDKVSLVTKE